MAVNFDVSEDEMEYVQAMGPTAMLGCFVLCCAPVSAKLMWCICTASLMVYHAKWVVAMLRWVVCCGGAQTYTEQDADKGILYG